KLRTRDSKLSSGMVQAPVEEFPDLTEGAADRALRAPGVLGNLRELGSLQPEFQHATAERIQSGKDPFELGGQGGSILGSGFRLPLEERGFFGLTEGQFPVNRPAVRALMSGLSEQLVLGDGRQQPPEVAAAAQREAAGSRPDEEAPIDRQHDV